MVSLSTYDAGKKINGRKRHALVDGAASYSNLTRPAFRIATAAVGCCVRPAELSHSSRKSSPAAARQVTKLPRPP